MAPFRVVCTAAALSIVAACSSSPPKPATDQPAQPSARSVPAAQSKSPAAKPTAARPKQPRADDEAATAAADQALELIGKPYRYGGSSLAGFDCSGLVQYSYKRAGLALPRETGDQRQASIPIRRADLRKGDLVFFDQEGKKSSHVGIYIGHGRFVHAPSSGGKVKIDQIDAPYWVKHFSEARRI